jgi:tyrosinase
MAIDERKNFKNLKKKEKRRFIKALRWMKFHDASGSASSTGGVYQKYVNWYKDTAPGGPVYPKYNYTAITLTNPVAGDELKSITIDDKTIEPKVILSLTDFRQLNGFLNSIVANEVSRSKAAEVLNFQPVFDVIGKFVVSEDAGNLKIECLNSPYVVQSVGVIIGGIPSTLNFTQGAISTGNWQLSNYQVAHNGPSFLPWNRAFLRLFELDLKVADKQQLTAELGGLPEAEEYIEKNGEISLPYWNFVRDNGIPTSRFLWSDEDYSFGGDGNAAASDKLDTGPFKHTGTAEDWVLHGAPTAYLKRQLGRNGKDHARVSWDLPSLYKVKNTPASRRNEFLTVMSRPLYDVYPFNEQSSQFSFRSMLEGGYRVYNNQDPERYPQMSNGVHMWLGGTMAMTLHAPNDPVFFIAYCNVDRLWAIWQNKNSNQPQYPDIGPVAGRRLTDNMLPWFTGSGIELSPQDVLRYKQFPSDVVTHLGEGYQYDSDSLINL